MNKNLIKLLTRDLIEACGGLKTASDACGLSEGQLSRCQNANAPDTLNIFAMYRLERCAGKPIVSEPISKACGDDAGADVFEEILDVVQAAGQALDVGRRAKADGKVTENERREIDEALNHAERQIREARAANAA